MRPLHREEAGMRKRRLNGNEGRLEMVVDACSTTEEENHAISQRDMKYSEFLQSKEWSNEQAGFKPVWIPDFLFNFQKALTEWSIERGKSAIFADCGLGKTPCQLVWAENVVRKTNKNVLIVTPLAVSHQTLREAKKFGIRARRSKDGQAHKGITVTNYERLERFDPKDYQGVVVDECFPQDTKISVFSLDKSLTSKYIRDVCIGDLIYNVCGEDHVKGTTKRQVNRAVRLEINGRKITCSENHLFFTLHGWRPAKHIQPGDYLLETGKAVRLLRGDILPGILCNEDAEILQRFLLSEMEDETARNSSEGSLSRSSKKERTICIQMEEQQQPEGDKGEGSARQTKSYGESHQCSKDDRDQDQERHFSSVEREERGERTIHKASVDSLPSSGQGLEVGITDTDRIQSNLPNGLQSRHREQTIEDRRGDRRDGTYQQASPYQGPKEGTSSEILRVDRVEILEPGHPDLERYREKDGFIYFYDLQATRHPSYTVEGLCVHNSSILKNFDGKTRKLITEFVHGIPYRLLCTATPAPNDFMELGTSAEALNTMTYNQMLAMFFTHKGETTSQWTLKAHAKKRFWEWVSTWARAVRRPSDLGYDNGKFALPLLTHQHHIVRSPLARGCLIVRPAVTMEEQRAERKMSLQSRCEEVARIVAEKRKEPWVIWCHLNSESDLLEKIIPNAHQVCGFMSDEEKEAKLVGFVEGDIQILVTKPRIGGFGMNWQHCSNVSYFPDDSYEKFYQCVRRCWRFGQEREVFCHVVSSERQSRIVRNMMRKERQASEMYDGLIRCMSDYQKGVTITTSKKNQTVIIPSWLS